jgi:hypothetical protein
MTDIRIDKDSIVGCLRELEFMIVSLDHLGSTGFSSASMEKLAYRFLVDGGVFRRLATIRSALSSCLDANLSPNERDQIEAILEEVRPWDFRSTESD